MNNDIMVERLKKVGVQFSNGLSGEEIQKIEKTFGFRFPKEIASFLSYAYPIGPYFFDYRDLSPKNIKAFNDFQQRIKDDFIFDIENNTESIKDMFFSIIGKNSEKSDLKNVIMTALDKSPRLIPFYAHRCFFDGMDGMPIISFYQAVDTVFYGSDFENYLENEFLNGNNIGTISDQIKNTGIWYLILN